MNIGESEFEKSKYKLSALENNIKAIKSVVSAVEGTLGPRGMDCMIVDDYGNAIITNDGITILKEISVTHPAAKLLINSVMAQKREAGDGTTTLTVLTGALLDSAFKAAEKGVPMHKIIDGLKKGIKKSIEITESEKILITEENENLLEKVAFISGRGNEDISQLVYKASEIIGYNRMREKEFRLSDCVEVIEDAENQVFGGVIVDKKPLNLDMSQEFEDVKILILDDSLDVEEFRRELLATEGGFNKYLESVDEIKMWAEKLIDLNIGIVLCSRGVNPIVEQILSDGGVCVVDRVLYSQLEKTAKYCGCKILKNNSLRKSVSELNSYCGRAGKVIYDSGREQLRIQLGKGKPYVTIVISASTAEIIREKERITRDAASSVQFSVCDGVVAGGGAFEIYCSNRLKKYSESIYGMEKYGVYCVAEALKKPFLQMVENAGLNPLETFEKILNVTNEQDKKYLSVDFDSGKVRDMLTEKVFDPASVKKSVFKKAGEVAEAILKINLILKGKTSN
jgi:chaperonin GroEL (HSP60 family)